MSSILNDIKHTLGITEDETAFDIDLIIFINGTFATLNQLGAGADIGYQITGPDNQWEEFFTDARLNAVKTYIFLCCKMAFNPPDSPGLMQALERQKLEHEYRINVVADYG